MTTPSASPEERIAAIKARVNAATEGPWRALDSGNNYLFVFAKAVKENVCAMFWGGSLFRNFSNNAAFIAHAREDIPWLLDQRHAAQAENASLRASLERMKAVVKQIAGQKTLSELSEAGEDCEGDFEGAYDTMIELARAALDAEGNGT